MLVKKYYLILLSQVTSHTSLIGIHKLVTPSNRYYQVVIHLLLQKQTPVVVSLILLHELLELTHSGLERKQIRKLLQHQLNPSSALPKEEVLQLSTEHIIHKNVRI